MTYTQLNIHQRINMKGIIADSPGMRKAHKMHQCSECAHLLNVLQMLWFITDFKAACNSFFSEKQIAISDTIINIQLP